MKYYIEPAGNDGLDFLFGIAEGRLLTLATRDPEIDQWIQAKHESQRDPEINQWIQKNTTAFREITKEEAAMILFQCRG